MVDHTLEEGSLAYERMMVFLVNGSIITHCMCYFNSAINPIIYYVMSAQFKVSDLKYKLWDSRAGALV